MARLTTLFPPAAKAISNKKTTFCITPFLPTKLKTGKNAEIYYGANAKVEKTCINCCNPSCKKSLVSREKDILPPAGDTCPLWTNKIGKAKVSDIREYIFNVQDLEECDSFAKKWGFEDIDDVWMWFSLKFGPAWISRIYYEIELEDFTNGTSD